MNMLLSALVLLMLSYLAYRLLRLAWYKLHDMAGIEVGLSQYTLPTTVDSTSQRMRLTHQAALPGMPIPNTFASDSRFELLPRAKHSTKKRKSTATVNQPTFAVQSMLGIDVATIGRMPTSAVMLLDAICDKLMRYQDWQREHSQPNQQTAWLTENKFVVNRLIEQTIPEAISQYDQIAKYHPSQLAEKITHGMTAGEMLTDVLVRVNVQLDELLNDLFQDVSQQFASTYRYVKQRT